MIIEKERDTATGELPVPMAVVVLGEVAQIKRHAGPFVTLLATTTSAVAPLSSSSTPVGELEE